MMQGRDVVCAGTIEKECIEKQRQRSSCLFGGAEFVQFLAALAVLHESIWKKRLNSSYSSKSTEAKQLARQEIEQRYATTFAFTSLSILLLWLEPRVCV